MNYRSKERKNKEAKAFHPPHEFLRKQILLEQHISFLETDRQREIELKSKPEEFFRQVLGCEPYDYQLELIKLFEHNQLLAICWPRQSGKSWTISALLLNYALTHPNAHIAVIGPSWRQSKMNIRKITNFLPKLGGLKTKAQKTRIDFGNGSVIEAFPNNPETIRGPTFNVIFWDEVNFTPNDVDLYDAIMPTLGTTNGKLVCTSTPWNKDSVFYKMCNDEHYSDFARHHITWERAQEPYGPLKKNTLEKIKRQLSEDPLRWRREWEAEWGEDEDAWLPQSLIASCIGTVKNCGEDMQVWNPDKGYSGDLFAGLDLAQVRDYCVFSVLERINDKLFLRYLKVFAQPAKYASVIGYVKTLQDRWGGFQKLRVDFTKEGPAFVSDMEDAGVQNVEGVNFSLPRKSEMASLLKQRMLDQRLFIPWLKWDKPFSSDLCSELNVERYELKKDGTFGLFHPNGTHDDVFWSIALAVYATVNMKAIDVEALRFG